MPTFKLKDGFGLNVNITPGSGALSRYFQNLPDFSVSTINLSSTPASSVEGGITFSQPINIGTSGVELTVGASASGTLSLFVPQKDGDSLFEPDSFGDNVKVGKEQRYVSMTLTAQLKGGASVSPGDLKFGFDGKSAINLCYYERFDAGAALLSAVEDTIANFSIPGDLNDLTDMPAHSIATVDGSGELKFSGSVNLLTLANPLATAALPAGLGQIGVISNVAIDVGADYKFSGNYQLRIQKLSDQIFRMGFYRQRNSQFDFTVDANAGLSAQFGDHDLIAEVLEAISSNPQVDLQQLKVALSADEAQAIQTAVQRAINRALEIGVSLELSRRDESDAMFLYEVDLSRLTPDGRSMLHAALDGDLSTLVHADQAPPDGISVVKSLISSTKTLQHTFTVNLLGIYNVLQISKLILEGTTAWDADTGAIVMTDKATADSIQVITSNLQAKDSDKLRQILAEHFLITAVYRAVSNIVSGSPELSGQQTYFDLQSNPGKVRMRDYVLVSAALGLQTLPVAKREIPVNVDDFDQTLAYAETRYDDHAFRSLFFTDKGGLYPEQMYSDAGRLAISYLVEPGDDDDFRLALATNPALFNDLSQIGNVNSKEFHDRCVAAGVPDSMVPVVGTDYLDVAWFTQSMVTAGQKLQEIDLFLEANPGIDPENNDFKKLKQQLADSLGQVADQATTSFGGPWGFTTMALLGKASSTKWMLINKFIINSLSAGHPTTAPLAEAVAVAMA